MGLAGMSQGGVRGVFAGSGGRGPEALIHLSCLTSEASVQKGLVSSLFFVFFFGYEIIFMEFYLAQM